MALDDDTVYVELRPLLFSIAYRMTGSVQDAEDIASETFLRYRRARADGVSVQSPRAYLTTTATRLSISLLRSARHHREVYVGPWLPEPLITPPHDDVAGRAEMADSLSMAFLVLLEALSPVERAVFLLREVFGYDYAAIATIVGKSEVNCRQLLRRAKTHVVERAPRFGASREQRDRIARTFFAAIEDGNLDALVEVLTDDVVVYGDGGGVGPSLLRPVHGRDRVLRLLASLSEVVRHSELHAQPVTVNGQPGAAVREENGLLLNVFALDIVDGRIQTVRSVINPQKLRHLGPLRDPRTLLRTASGELGADVP